MERIYNFSAGPATLPLEVLEETQAELLNYKGTGMSILEMSHRTKPFEAVNMEAEQNMKDLLGVDDEYRVLFLQGGASMQFAMLPLNLLREGTVGNYILTGSWAEKALHEAKLLGETHIAATTEDGNFQRIPHAAEIHISDRPAYVHLTSNNTIHGTQWHEFPNIAGVPMVADMSSDILSREFDAKRFSLIYAGAQKNLGPAGVTVVIIHKDLLQNIPKHLPTMLRYDTHAKNDSLYNTPPTFSVYMVNLVLRWMRKQGGMPALAERNRDKAQLIYDAIDQSGGFYRGHAASDSRSLMNITFRVANPDLENIFAEEAKKVGLDGLKGHRSVGGLRASIYNAMPKAGCKALQEFMVEFQRKHG